MFKKTPPPTKKHKKQNSELLLQLLQLGIPKKASTKASEGATSSSDYDNRRNSRAATQRRARARSHNTKCSSDERRETNASSRGTLQVLLCGYEDLSNRRFLSFRRTGKREPSGPYFLKMRTASSLVSRKLERENRRSRFCRSIGTREPSVPEFREIANPPNPDF